MIQINTIKDFYGDTFIKKVNGFEFEDMLSAETISFLENIGLPKEAKPIIECRFDDILYQTSERFIRIGKTLGGDDILIDILDNESIGFENSPTKLTYISKNIQVMLECFYEYEFFFKEVLEKETLGHYGRNKQKYADYFAEKLLNLDEDTLDYSNISKSYFWGSFMESIESGI
ncbi:hypothetical protein [Emticicia fontis]